MTPFPYQGNSILSAQGKSQPMINHNALRRSLTPWFNVGNQGTTRSLCTLTQTRRCLPHSHSTTVCRRSAQVDGGVEGREGRPSDNGRTSLNSHYTDQAVSSC